MTKKKANAKTQHKKEEITDENRLTTSIHKAIRFDSEEEAEIVAHTLEQFRLVQAEIDISKIGGFFYLVAYVKRLGVDPLFVADPS
jgi:hypothetical protein